jgi:hypothetical protein
MSSDTQARCIQQAELSKTVRALRKACLLMISQAVGTVSRNGLYGMSVWALSFRFDPSLFDNRTPLLGLRCK